MSVWIQVLFQESYSFTTQLLSLFHDYSLAIILMILRFVSVISVSIVFNKFISDSVIITLVEVVWTVVPVIILVSLAIPSLQILYYMEENDPFLTLKVVGHQWYWSYEISDLNLEFDSYIIQSPELGEYRLLDVDHRVVLPIIKDLRAVIRGADVLHCWSIARLGIKADAVPGRLNQVYFNILRSGIVYGQCSEICGANHRFIPIVIEGVSLNNFFNWCGNFNN